MRPTYIATMHEVIHTASQQKWPRQSPQDNMLAMAMRLAEPGDSIGFIGTHNGLNIGNGNKWSPNTVTRALKPVEHLTIMGLRPNARIVGEINFQQTPGIAAPNNLTFKDFALMCGNNQRGFLTYQNQGPFHNLTFENITIDTTHPTKTPNKWAFRFHGPASFNVINCSLPFGNQEHFVYADNVCGDSSVVGCVARRNGRTMVQIVNRGISGPSSTGNILIEDCTAMEAGHIEGASAFTVAGHLGGTVTFRNCATYNSHGGSLVVWGEQTKGPILNATGDQVDHVVIENCDFNSPNADRDCIMLSNATKVEMGHVHINTNKNGIRLDAVQNKPVRDFLFTVPTPSRLPITAYRKVVRGYSSSTTVELTPQEIDALYKVEA